MRQRLILFLFFLLLLPLCFSFSSVNIATGASVTNNFINQSNITNIVGISTIASPNSTILVQNGTLTNLSVNQNLVQYRVNDTCSSGSSIRLINADGTVVCENDSSGGNGTVTSVGLTATSNGGVINITNTPITTSGNINIFIPNSSVTQDGLFTAVQATSLALKALAGNCASGTFVQNATTAGVQCFTPPSSPNNITGVGSTGNLSYWSNSSHLLSSILFYNTVTRQLGIHTLSPAGILDIRDSGVIGTVATGNGVQANDSLIIRGTQGGNTTATGSPFGGKGGGVTIVGGVGGFATGGTSNTRGGAGGDLTFISGSGQNNSRNGTTTVVGGAGGTITFNGGNGGTPSGLANQLGGTGGGVTFLGGVGGVSNNGTSGGGSGGVFTLSAGAGGRTFFPASGAGGQGGTMTFTSGAGGQSASGAGGQGGDFSLLANSAGQGNITGNLGGAVLFRSGSGSSVVGNGTATGGTFAEFRLRGGASAFTNGTGGKGADINIVAGGGGTRSSTIAGSFNGTGGTLYMRGGQGNVNGLSVYEAVIINCNESLVCGGYTGLGLNPVAKLHQDDGTAIANYHKFTAGSTTGQTITDGFDIGITATGEAQLRQYESQNLTIWTNATSRITVNNFGNITIATLTGTGNDYVCVDSTGMLYRSDGVCA